MSSRSISIVTTFRNFLVSMLLWTYAGCVLFTWYFARMTPDWAVLLRVSASILNDLVWIPPGIIIWSLALMLVTGKTGKSACKSFIISFFIIAGGFFLSFSCPIMHSNFFSFLSL